MKAFTLLVLSISVLFFVNVELASALDQDDFSVSPSWSTPLYYQGDSVSVKLILSSKTTETLTVYYVGIHFDWMEEGSFFGRDLSDQPVVVESSEVHVFDPMAVTIPSDVGVGEHNYTIGIHLAEGASPTVVPWDSHARIIYVQPGGAKAYNELVKNVSLKIGEGINATYQNPKAISLLEQAESEYAQAFASFYAEEWEDAIAHLQAADSYADQAAVAEDLGSEQSAEFQRLLWIVAPIVTAVIVSFIVVIFWRRRQPPDDELEQPIEKQEYTQEE